MTTNEKRKTSVSLPSDLEIQMARTFDAPRRLVWQAYTQAEHLKNWWGPKGWTLPVCELDFRQGGTWLYCMQGPDMTSCGKATFIEIVELERIVYTDEFSDGDGNPVPDMPVANITLLFSESGGKTTITSISRYESKELRDQILEMGASEGTDQTYDRLDELLQNL